MIIQPHLPLLYLLHFSHTVLFSYQNTYYSSLVMKLHSIALLTLSLFTVCNTQSLTVPRESQTPTLTTFHPLTSHTAVACTGCLVGATYTTTAFSGMVALSAQGAR